MEWQIEYDFSARFSMLLLVDPHALSRYPRQRVEASTYCWLDFALSKRKNRQRKLAGCDLLQFGSWVNRDYPNDWNLDRFDNFGFHEQNLGRPETESWTFSAVPVLRIEWTIFRFWVSTPCFQPYVNSILSWILSDIRRRTLSTIQCLLEDSDHPESIHFRELAC
jgi:hypothetical protein